jgi:hypothetical protein
MVYRLPTEHERRAYFAYLKQASSLTAWERVLESHREFINIVREAFEKTQKLPPPDGEPYIATSEMSGFLRCQSALSKAVERLRAGDKSCFKWLGAPGHFNEGLRFISAWAEAHGNWIYSGGAEFMPALSPDWPAIEAAMNRCLAICGELALVLEPRHTDVPAPIQKADRHSSTQPLIKSLLSRDTLPAVPKNERRLIIETGEIIPYSGIWEPVSTPFSRGEWFGTTGGELLIDGCMNYLHLDSPAPTIAFEGDSPRKEGRRTRWQLIWSDERYGDRGTPEEERHYVFTVP